MENMEQTTSHTPKFQKGERVYFKLNKYGHVGSRLLVRELRFLTIKEVRETSSGYVYSVEESDMAGFHPESLFEKLQEKRSSVKRRLWQALQSQYEFEAEGR
jgi:hypothetical protein